MGGLSNIDYVYHLDENIVIYYNSTNARLNSGGVIYIYIYTTHYKHTPTLPNMGYVFGDRLPAMYIDNGQRCCDLHVRHVRQ